MQITLKAARANKSLTQVQAASKLGIDPDTLRRWENAESFPNVPQIQKIEQVYGLSYSDIIFLPETSV
jgi:transcriptional regulator with XRE-family HTH domain